VAPSNKKALNEGFFYARILTNFSNEFASPGREIENAQLADFNSGG